MSKNMQIKEDAALKKFSFGKCFKKYGTIFGLVLLCIGLTILTPVFISPGNIITILRQIAMLSILSAGLTVVMISKRIDLSVAYLASLAGVAVAALSKGAGLPLGIAVLLGTFIVLLFGALNGFLVAYLGIPDFIATLSVGFLASGFNQAYTHGKAITGLAKGFKIFAQDKMLGFIPNAIIFMAIFLVIISLLLERTRFGRYVYSIGGNEEATNLSGINTKLILFFTFLVCALGASLTGIVMTSRLGNAHPLACDNLLMDALAAVYLGGTVFKEGEPNLAGTFIGALIIGVLGNGLTLLNVPYYNQDIIQGIVIIAAVSYNSIMRIRKK